MIARGTQTLQIVSTVQPALANQQSVSGSFLCERERRLERYGKRPQVAVVDADKFCAASRRALHFGAGMALHERVHSEFVFGELSQTQQRIVIEGSRACRRGAAQVQVVFNASAREVAVVRTGW